MERNIPEISVIVPVYNVEQYLAECISSILSQTFTDFELLLVDDGSPDRCGEICDEYAGKDKRVRVFHQENAGLSCARNKGLEHASGTYIAFVDSDDYVTSTYLQELYASLPADKSQRGTVICGFDKLFPDGSLHTVHVPQFCIEEDEVQFSFLAQIMAVPEGLRIQYVVTVHKIYVLAGSMQQSSVACNG